MFAELKQHFKNGQELAERVDVPHPNVFAFLYAAQPRKQTLIQERVKLIEALNRNSLSNNRM